MHGSKWLIQALLCWIIAIGFTPRVLGDIGMLYQATAANVSGQAAYSLRYNDKKTYEGSIFVNEYLVTSDGLPYLGAVYAWHNRLCKGNCLFNFSLNIGAGLSNVGPLVEIDLSLLILWGIRIDWANQLIYNQNRIINWSYPFWLGLSIPI